MKSHNWRLKSHEFMMCMIFLDHFEIIRGSFRDHFWTELFEKVKNKNKNKKEHHNLVSRMMYRIQKTKKQWSNMRTKPTQFRK